MPPKPERLVSHPTEGIISHEKGIGYYIQPVNDPLATVDFPIENQAPLPSGNTNFEDLPDGFEIGDKIMFTQSEGNIRADSMKKKE